jgi:hypothetical protein
MLSDERVATVLPGETLVDRQQTAAAGGGGGVRNLLAGGGGVTVVRIGRRESREIARTDIRGNGIIPQTIKKLARKKGIDTGLSGRPVIA